MATYYASPENSDDYFDEKPRKAKKIWKHFTMGELIAFLEGKKGQLYSNIPINGFKHKKIRHGIVFRSGGFEYCFGLK